jgi:hypothetical protein
MSLLCVCIVRVHSESSHRLFLHGSAAVAVCCRFLYNQDHQLAASLCGAGSDCHTECVLMGLQAGEGHARAPASSFQFGALVHMQLLQHAAEV